MQIQIRSADEPMTTFYRCTNAKCANQWVLITMQTPRLQYSQMERRITSSYLFYTLYYYHHVTHTRYSPLCSLAALPLLRYAFARTPPTQTRAVDAVYVSSDLLVSLYDER